MHTRVQTPNVVLAVKSSGAKCVKPAAPQESRSVFRHHAGQRAKLTAHATVTNQRLCKLCVQLKNLFRESPWSGSPRSLTTCCDPSVRGLGSQLRDRRAHYRFVPGKGPRLLASEASLSLCLARCALVNVQRADIGETKRLPAGRFLRHDQLESPNLARPAESNLGNPLPLSYLFTWQAYIRKAFSLPSSQLALQGSSVITVITAHPP